MQIRALFIYFFVCICFFKSSDSYSQDISQLEKQVQNLVSVYGDNSPQAIALYVQLGQHYVQNARYLEAELVQKKALEMAEKTFGPEHIATANCIIYLAKIYLFEKRTSEGVALMLRALPIFEKNLGKDNPLVAALLTQIGGAIHRGEGRYSSAETYFKKALSIYEKTSGPESLEVASALDTLAISYNDQGRYNEAEYLLRKSIKIIEKSLGLNAPELAPIIDHLAMLPSIKANKDEHELLLKRALKVMEDRFGPDHREVSVYLDRLSSFYADQQRYAEAETLRKRVNFIVDQQLAIDNSDISVWNKASGLSSLATLYARQGRYKEAEPLLKESLTLAEKVWGKDHPTVAGTLSNLALLNEKAGHLSEAIAQQEKVFEIRSRTLGLDHPNTASTLYSLTNLYMAKGDSATSLKYSRQFFQLYGKRQSRVGPDFAKTDEGKQYFATGMKYHMSVVGKTRAGTRGQDAALDGEAFEAGQLAQMSSTSDIISKMAARFASGSDSLAESIRSRQDAIVRINWLQTELRKSLGLDSKKRDSVAEQKIQAEIDALTKDIERLDGTIESRFPKYAELSSTRTVKINEAKSLLRRGEALLAYTVGETESYLFVVQPDRAEFKVLPVGKDELTASVQLLRARLLQSGTTANKIRPFDLEEAHALYERVFLPAEQLLTGVNNIHLVLDGPLQSLPFSVLVRSIPKEKIRAPEDYRKVDWLANRYGFAVLPSVSSLRAIRVTAKSGNSENPFVGFGDPALDGKAGTEAGKRAVSMEVLFNSNRGLADVSAIRQLDPLPETADELRHMANSLGVGNNSIFLRNNATESRVKDMDLSRTRVIAFSTHAAMAGELKGYSEPGLILTPPKEATDLDDGYLTASEIAQLKLNADWVLLSACSTASSDGKAGAEGLSGLAKAFFYAGARSLLVSHWPVDSVATHDIVTNLFSISQKNPALTKAEALQKAMLTVMNDPTHPQFAHPMFWAPFVIAGEGSVGLTH